MGFQRPFWRRSKQTESRRRIVANNAVENAQYNYSNNYISTSKYNVITFLPKNLFEQFKRIANAYFLCLLIMQFIPQIKALEPITTAIPLGIVLGMTAVKDLIDDIRRHRSDNKVNNRKSWVLRNGELVEARWQTVVVGEIIKLENDQFVAADLLLLSASEPNSICYIETAELDGETNLKVRQALTETSMMGDDIQQLSSFNAEVECEPPNNVLSKFEGAMTWRNESFSLDNDKLLLRGCVLRNTAWCFGLVVFAGRDTKLMMNGGKAKFKRTHIDQLTNILIIGIFIFLFVMCAIGAIGSGIWESYVGAKYMIYLPWESHVPSDTAGGATVIAILHFFSYIQVLNTVVPISLYVCVEMIRLGHSLLINWDNKMYYAKNDTPARSVTTTLNEELGQIEYIFSDKTGTLTQNVMTFNKCSINGTTYGDPLDERGVAVDVTERTPRVDFSQNPYHEPSFEFYDQRLLLRVEDSDADVHQFFRLLALCHTVMPAETDGKLEYQAQSPDEAALVGAARNFGFVFKSRTPDSITIEVLGTEEVYQLLSILDFNNVRKRMSVIVKDKHGNITLYCKGADTTVYERLAADCADLQDTTTLHLETFAQDGLRTLCCAVKKIDPASFEEWRQKYHLASIALENREERLSEVYEEIEVGMSLVGATAIEDKLQDGVPEAIANLARAGIKIWVLTGDKQETAINIGYSCKLLSDEMSSIFVVDADSFDQVEEQLRSANTVMLMNLKNDSMTQRDAPAAAGSEVKKDPTSFAIIINGYSLEHALTKQMELLLLETCCMCQAVVCCRVTPRQKAQVVELVKHNKQTVTLAIGDGANDVSMIKMAHIGVGISGQEGMQAVMASDYALAQFCFLERLLLVHGRWSYIRMCKFLKYFFYKNFAFTLCHFWFAFFCGFSAQALFDEWFIGIYNVVYTSTPVLVLGFLEQDVNDDYSLRYPKLYMPGQLDLLFNKKVFAQSIAEGVISSLVLFFIPYGTFNYALRHDGLDVSDLHALATVISAALIVVVTLRCGLETDFWTGINHLFIWGSIASYFVVTLVTHTTLFHHYYEGVAFNCMITANFWFTVLLCVVILLVPVLAEKFYYVDTRPSLTDKVRMKQRKMKPKRHAGEHVLRRASTYRRSQRSVGRSGYAFSHEEGFGELITSGSLMIRKHPNRPGISNVVAPATADNVTVSPSLYPDSVDDSGVASDGAVVISNDLATEGVPLSAVEETSFWDPDPKPRTPVVV